MRVQVHVYEVVYIRGIADDENTRISTAFLDGRGATLTMFLGSVDMPSTIQCSLCNMVYVPLCLSPFNLPLGLFCGVSTCRCTADATTAVSAAEWCAKTAAAQSLAVNGPVTSAAPAPTQR